MSYLQYIELYCDGPDCYETWPASSPTVHSLVEQRKEAKAAGWKVAQPEGKDYCPLNAAGLGRRTKHES